MRAALHWRLLRLAMDRQRSLLTCHRCVRPTALGDVLGGLLRFDEGVFHRLFFGRFGEER